MKLSAWFNDQSIQGKLVSTNVLVILTALVPIVAVMFGYEYYAVRNASLQEIRIQAAIVSDNAAAAMAFGDAQTASEALATLRASPDILSAALILPNGQVLTRYKLNGAGRSSRNDATAPAGDTEELSWNSFKLQKRVFLRTELAGTLVLESSLNSFHRRVSLYLVVILIATGIGLAMSMWLAIRLKRAITEPLLQLMSLTNRVASDQDYSVRPDVERADEIGDLSRSFRHMMDNLQDRDERLQNLAYYDNVTSLPNRHYFKERLEQAVGNALRYDTRCALMFIDLDDFKIVNDTLGHHIGDDLLREVGRRLTATLRNNDHVCRIGGDEFAVILENIKDLRTTEKLAMKIIEVLSKPAELQGHQVTVGASIGISACPDFADNTTDLLRTADVAMYYAKSHGKNTFHRFDGNVA